MTPRRLERRKNEGNIAGVCAGLADYFDTDVTFVRLAWIVLSIFPGAVIGGVVAYAAAWWLMPIATDELPKPERRRLVRSATDRKIAGVCGGIGEYFAIDATVVRLAVVILAIYPGAVVCGVVAYLIAWVVIPAPPAVRLEPSVSAP